MSEGYVHTGLEPNSAVDIPDPTQFDPQTVELVMRRLVRDGGLSHMPKDLDACCALVKKAMGTPDYSNYKSMYENLTLNITVLLGTLADGSPPVRNKAGVQPIYNQLADAVYNIGLYSENLQKDVEYALEIGELDSADCAFLPRHTKLGGKLLKHVVDIRTQAYTAAKATVALEYDVSIAIRNSGLNGPTGVYVPGTKTGERLYQHVMWLLGEVRATTDETKRSLRTLTNDIKELYAWLGDVRDISGAHIKTLEVIALRDAIRADQLRRCQREGALKEEKTAEASSVVLPGGGAQQAVNEEEPTPQDQTTQGTRRVPASRFIGGIESIVEETFAVLDDEFPLEQAFFIEAILKGTATWVLTKNNAVLSSVSDALSALQDMQK
jgi:hypothetical protein